MKNYSIPNLIAASALWVTASAANATTLTFEATYQSKLDIVSENINSDSNFEPVNFQFAVTFNPEVTQLLGPTYSSGSYVDSDGSTINYAHATANTLFGKPTFSSSPYTDQLSQGLITNPASWDASQSSQNQAYNFYDFSSQSYGVGHSSIAFQSYFQVQPNQNSIEGYSVYAFDIGLSLPTPPESLNAVGHIQSSDLLTYLIYARDTKTSWFAEEFGQYYPNDSPDGRTGAIYHGTATLISIDGVPAPSAVPLPATLPLMLSGLGVLAFTSRRRKATV